ncbi:MAG: DUF2235 domain-containing protein [Chitinophagaceae bacterium]
MADTNFTHGACRTDKTKKPETKKIRATLFFDGTLNNKRNTEIGMARVADVFQHAKDMGTSYGNYYTNVALLFNNLNVDELGGYHKYIPIYIEGIGTENERSDSKMGAAFGAASTGIRAKVANGRRDLVNRIGDFIKKKEVEIEEIRIDVYGFSRGAAAARHFVNVALNTTNIIIGENTITVDSLKVQLQKAGFKVGTVKVYFVGLFDTVSSEGFSGTVMGMSDVVALGLDAIKDAVSVYHLAALDEHRDNFALTNIKSAGGKGREIFLPGVHSDIGGSYNTRERENIQIYDTDVPYITESKYQSIKAELDGLIKGGWFRWTDIQNVKEGRGMKVTESIDDAVNWHGEVYVKRMGLDGLGIKNMYARIPLHMMKDASKGIAFNPKMDTAFATSIHPGMVDDIVLRAYSALKGGSVPASWSQSKDNATASESIKTLRYSHLHFSANYEESAKVFAPNAPRYFKGQRTRKIHDG